MNDRIRKLRSESLSAVPYLTDERARIVTETYNKYSGKVSVPVLRALVFRNIMENKAIDIQDGELIVGERGPKPHAVPTYPELCCHTDEDLRIINDREKISFKVSSKMKEYYAREIRPYWEGRSMRDLIFSNMTEEWKNAYEAGIFTEFMEQRAPGHTVADDKIYKKGFLDFIDDIDESLRNLDYLNDEESFEKEQQLKAMRICAYAIIRLAERYSEKAMEKAAAETDVARKQELLKIAEITKRVPAHAPRNFWEALQAYWFVHIGVISELNTWDSFNPGRLDQHLYPFYKKEIEQGTLNHEFAKELLQCFWVKFNNQDAPPKVGVTLKESGTYTDFANINVGGLKIDGTDGVNEVSYLLLDVIDEMRLLQPSSNIQLSKKSPDRFLRRAVEIIKKGWGQPSVFNADAVIEELIRQGKSIEDARCGGTSGCVEAGAFGKESYILTGYFNLVKVLEITMYNGTDPMTGKKIGIETGDILSFTSFEQLMEAYKKQMHYFIDIKVKGNHIIEKLYAKLMPSPFLSIVISDCISKGKDYNAGGARYNTTYIQGVGIGSVTDCLTSIKYHVFDKNTLSMKELINALECNFEGLSDIRNLFLNKTPKYGNDDPYADDIMLEVFNMYYSEVDGRKNMAGGFYRIDMLPTTCHVYFGSVTGATPDGRLKGVPLSEGISPVQGADREGPTAVIKSASKMDHLRTGGTLLNIKFTPALLRDGNGILAVMNLIRTYFRLDGHHIQFNVVDKETLIDAQKNPEKHRNLIVRVAGYSDYFCNLNTDLQNEIIARTGHGTF
jgi:pyruvate formate-lyase/glycerol dehydratase family glycyl radical enzyme